VIRLVINADDLGLHPRIDEGIFRAHSNGVVSSATLLVTGRRAPEAIRRATAEGLPLGLHLCLSSHLPPAAHPSAVRWLAPGGRFRRDWAQVALAFGAGLIPKPEIELELASQLRQARALGAHIDHLDSHQHLHLLPGLTPLVEDFAMREGLPLRWPVERPTLRWLTRPAAGLKAAALTALGRLQHPAGAQRLRCLGVFESGRLSERRLLRLLTHLEPGDWELVTHPGLAPGSVAEDPEWTYGWEDELAALSSPRIRVSLERHGVQLTSYAELFGSKGAEAVAGQMC
jgi:predicted glycoside hydrolase/deacetylase ChbG (UPF0249 family)